MSKQRQPWLPTRALFATAFIFAATPLLTPISASALAPQSALDSAQQERSLGAPGPYDPNVGPPFARGIFPGFGNSDEQRNNRPGLNS